jgi:GNAT superfamily N-acetyltransferase
MGLVVLPALIPDIPTIYDIYFAAFGRDAMGAIMLDILFPGGNTGTTEFRKQHAEDTLRWWHHSTTQYTWKCVDTETGEIIGMALGDTSITPRSSEERKNLGVGWLSGEEKERAEKVLDPLWEMRERLFGGRPYLCKRLWSRTPPGLLMQTIVDCHVIAVDPKHQGRKAGALLCQMGLDLCDQAGIPLYFEASPSTVGLYEKMGFQRLKETIVHKAEVLGTPEDIEVPLVVRMPNGTSWEEYQAAGKTADHPADTNGTDTMEEQTALEPNLENREQISPLPDQESTLELEKATNEHEDTIATTGAPPQNRVEPENAAPSTSPELDAETTDLVEPPEDTTARAAETAIIDKHSEAVSDALPASATATTTTLEPPLVVEESTPADKVTSVVTTIQITREDASIDTPDPVDSLPPPDSGIGLGRETQVI